jgi:hypothetical protein
MSKRPGGCLAGLLKLLVLCVILFYGVVGLTSPWAFHIGGRWTPLLYWSGYGMLVTKDRTYPLSVFFYPSAQFSRLHLDDLRPTGGVQGTASLCISPGVVEALKLGGTIFGDWRSTDDALIEFRLLEIRVFNVGQSRGFFDLYGRWRGADLVMDDRGRANTQFRAGPRIEHASITLSPDGASEYKSRCAAGPRTTADSRTRS